MRINLLRDEKGFAILAVLGIVIVLGFLAASIAVLSQSEARGVSTSAALLRLRLAAEGGLHRGIYEVLETSGGRSLHGQMISMNLDGVQVQVEISDEAGRIDLNSASPEVMAQFFSRLGVDDSAALADRIADWRDVDDLVRLSGAEAIGYGAAGLPPPENRPFLSFGELRNVMGFPSELVPCLGRYATLYAGRQSPDWRTAPAELREVFGDGVELATSAISGNVPAASAVVGRTYRIVATAEDNQGRSMRLRAIIRPTRSAEQPYRVYEWTQEFTAEEGCVTSAAASEGPIN